LSICIQTAPWSRRRASRKPAGEFFERGVISKYPLFGVSRSRGEIDRCWRLRRANSNHSGRHPRRTFLHLSYSYAPPYGPALLVTQCQVRTHAMQQRRRYSNTSSAIASTPGGMVKPSVFAVLRLMTNSNLVGCWIGRSEGLAPFNILST
jgi:hypothetical protein